MNAELYKKLHCISLAKTLPEHEYFASLCKRALSTLENEKPAYRPRSSFGGIGGLLDFRKTPLPLVVVPDIHARADFLWNILSFIPPDGFLPHRSGMNGSNLFAALSQGLVRIVLVGDILHSEARGFSRWKEAETDFVNGVADGNAMRREMQEGLSSLCMILECKTAFSEVFHCLKGNHENIMNQAGRGDFPFRKFANEGAMTRLFMQSVYGDAVLRFVSCVERALPLMAVFDNCIVSHAEPEKAFTEAELIDGLGDNDTVRSLTWTENDFAAEGSVAALLKALCPCSDIHSMRCFGGHRPVAENYALRQCGLFVQLHNPSRQNVALVYADKVFNPDTDIVCVEKETGNW